MANYPTSGVYHLDKPNNDGTSLPSPGDVVSEAGTTTNPAGHTAIIISVSVNASGIGTAKILEQNGSSTGSRDISVTNKVLGDGVTSWLHDPNGGGASDGSRLSAVSMSNNQQMVFWRGSEGNLWAAYWSGSAWYKQNLGYGTLNSPPAAVYQPPTGWVQVFWEGPGHTLYQAINNNGTWVGGWNLNVGSTVYSQPTAAVNGSQVGVFWKDSTGHLQEAACNGSTWVPFNLGSYFWNISSAPSAFFKP